MEYLILPYSITLCSAPAISNPESKQDSFKMGLFTHLRATAHELKEVRNEVEDKMKYGARKMYEVGKVAKAGRDKLEGNIGDSAQKMVDAARHTNPGEEEGDVKEN